MALKQKEEKVKERTFLIDIIKSRWMMKLMWVLELKTFEKDSFEGKF